MINMVGMVSSSSFYGPTPVMRILANIVTASAVLLPLVLSQQLHGTINSDENCGMIFYHDDDCQDEAGFARAGDDECHTLEFFKPGETTDPLQEKAFHFYLPLIQIYKDQLVCEGDNDMYAVYFDGDCTVVQEKHDLYVDKVRTLSFSWDCKE